MATSNGTSHLPPIPNTQETTDIHLKALILFSREPDMDIDISQMKQEKDRIMALTKSLRESERIDAISEPFYESNKFSVDGWRNWYYKYLNDSDIILVVCSPALKQILHNKDAGSMYEESCQRFYTTDIYSILETYHKYDKCIYVFLERTVDKALLPGYIKQPDTAVCLHLSLSSDTKELGTVIRGEAVQHTVHTIQDRKNTFSRVSRVSKRKETSVAKEPAGATKAEFVKEGWLIFCDNKSPKRQQYYCRLSYKSLSFSLSPDSGEPAFEVTLASILTIMPHGAAGAHGPPTLSPPPCLLLTTNTGMEYYIGLDVKSKDELAQFSSRSAQPGDVFNLFSLSESDWSQFGIGLASMVEWENEIHALIMPFTLEGDQEPQPPEPKPSKDQIQGPGPIPVLSDKTEFIAYRPARKQRFGAAHKQQMRGSFRVPKAMTDASVKTETLDISLFYQVFHKEILGSGQFGTVFGGANRKTGSLVAVKAIEKSQFPINEKQALMNEVLFLQGTSHPGIVVLERVFENWKMIFVVMERLAGDMLELILTQPSGRLEEIHTKTIIYQILIALRYLHRHDAVHCDLKPENVLLVSKETPYRVKLCDFGYARMINTEQFRRSLVGTPAYVAPEVLDSSGYNRALDMWSTGVITYVSLSGTFPFNEDEDIKSQVSNQEFMFPSHPWKLVSKPAMDLINRLMEVSVRQRYNVSKALHHPWFSDKSLWLQLKQIEARVGSDYLTSEKQDQEFQAIPENRAV